MMGKSYIADDIMIEYARKKRYEYNQRRRNIEAFKRTHCINCKNKNTNLCSITINTDGILQCVYKKD